MIDFQCHILPEMDNGSDSIETSIKILRESYRQGIDVMVATPHFYSEEETPKSFLSRRQESYELLQLEMAEHPEISFPEIKLGAEVLYFSGMGDRDDLKQLEFADTGCILIEPPMVPWTEPMFDEIARMSRRIRLLPIIAHVDQYMRILKDDSLINRVRAHNMLVQVNAEYFLRPNTSVEAVEMLEQGMIHLIGSDCCDLKERPQNIGAAAGTIAKAGAARSMASLNAKGYQLLKIKG